MDDHDHDHHHEHDHDHAHRVAVVASERAGGGPCVLDIGGDVGALVVTLTPAWLGHELHARRAGEASTTHTGVWERPVGRRTAVVAVFPALAEGTWRLLDQDGGEWCAVAVVGGEVTAVDLAGVGG